MKMPTLAHARMDLISLKDDFLTECKALIYALSDLVKEQQDALDQEDYVLLKELIIQENDLRERLIRTIRAQEDINYLQTLCGN